MEEKKERQKKQTPDRLIGTGITLFVLLVISFIGLIIWNIIKNLNIEDLKETLKSMAVSIVFVLVLLIISALIYEFIIQTRKRETLQNIIFIIIVYFIIVILWIIVIISFLLAMMFLLYFFMEVIPFTVNFIKNSLNLTNQQFSFYVALLTLIFGIPLIFLPIILTEEE